MLLNAIISTLFQQNDNENQISSEFPNHFFFIIKCFLDSFSDDMHEELTILKGLNTL